MSAKLWANNSKCPNCGFPVNRAIKAVETGFFYCSNKCAKQHVEANKPGPLHCFEWGFLEAIEEAAEEEMDQSKVQIHICKQCYATQYPLALLLINYGAYCPHLFGKEVLAKNAATGDVVKS